jgi:hypothetical protein
VTDQLNHGSKPYNSDNTSVTTTASAAIASAVDITGSRRRAPRPSVAVATAAWGVAYEYAQWPVIGKPFKIDNIQQLAKLDFEYQHVDEHIYAERQPEYALDIDVCHLGVCLIHIIEHISQP